MTGCPSRADLVGLIADDRSNAPRADIDQHIESCPECQTRLAEMTESADATRWRQLLNESVNGSSPPGLATPPPPPRAEAPIPEIPGFRIVREIGRGGAAIVYLARQSSLNRLVALKVLRVGSEPDAVHRFRTEAEAAAQLRHPNIVVVHEVGEAGACCYLAQEYLEAGTLAEASGRKPVPARTVASLMEPVARALDHAHRLGIIHRDVKPSNILLAGAGELHQLTPKVCDFGLARRLDEGAGLTRTHDLLGTPGYMAPELVADAGQVSPRSDVYAVGVMLYELLTGRPPFIGNTPLDTLLQARDTEPVPPRRLQPAVPLDLQNICLKCLEKAPARRFATAGALADDLNRFLNGQPVRARPISKFEYAARWARRHRGLAAALALVTVLIVAGTTAAAVAAGYFRRQAHDMELLAQDKEDERQKAVAARKLAEAQRELTLSNLYFTRSNLTGLALASLNRAQQIEQFQREWRGLKMAADPRGWEWFYFQTLNQRATLNLNGHELDVLAVAWSPDGRRLASAGFGRALHIWDAETGRQLAVGAAGWGIRALAWSPDGQRIITSSSDSKIQIHDAATGEVVQKVLEPEKLLAWSPDWRHIAGMVGNAVVVWTPDGRKEFELHQHTAPPTAVAWNGAGDIIASADAKGRVCLWDEPTRRLLRSWQCVDIIAALRWSPDGATLACAEWNSRVTLWNATTGEKSREFPGVSPHSLDSVAFAPDGQTFATGNLDRSINIWDVASGKSLATLTGHAFGIHSVAFKPDGQWLASGSGNWNGEVKLWRLPVADIPRSLTTIGDRQNALAWSGDGQNIVVGDANAVRLIDSDRGALVRAIPYSVYLGHFCVGGGRHVAIRKANHAVALWDAATGVESPMCTDEPFAIRRVSVSPDGKRLATTHRQEVPIVSFTCRVWNRDTNSVIHEAPGTGSGWSPDGRLLAVGDSYKVSIVNPESLQVVASWPTPEIDNSVLVFSADSRRLAAITQSNVTVRDLASGAIAFRLIGHNAQVLAVQWSPDGTRIATGSEDQTVRLWDSATGQLILTLRGHAGPVQSVAWSPDGRQLVSAGGGSTKVWDARPGYKSDRVRSPLPGGPSNDTESSSPRGRNGAIDMNGWWVINAEAWDPSAPDPFVGANPSLRWYVAADDPNGYLPLAHDQLVYLTRFHAPRATTQFVLRSGPIATRLWLDGQQLADDKQVPITLSPGWHTLAAAIADPVKQADVVARPRAGLMIRLIPRPNEAQDNPRP